ncbi:4'-phosphopantetheinyl transferase superfamily protein [Candidatus Gracilibacteria bacterium]|nr:4'-phosphopantetheinyl transferase superfamily protein [Candidatus Gracilibacteria bacterium]
MNYFEYHPRNKEIVMRAKEVYSGYFDFSMSDESIEARFYLYEYLRTSMRAFSPLEKDVNGVPIPIILENNECLYWSISHTEKYVAFIISDTQTGIDIAELRDRDPSLLDIHSEDEYNLLGEKDWKQFYMLWTAKESIIKASSLTLDVISEIRLVGVCEGDEFLFVFEEKEFRIHTVTQDTFILSYIF